MSNLKLPTETVELPSKGLVYPKSSPLAAGKLEIKYATSREEDILTNANYIADGTVYDRWLKSIIVTPINYDELILGDKDALYISARILAYGKDYKTTIISPETGNAENYTIDLTEIKDKSLAEDILKCNGVNEFAFKLPNTGTDITFKLLTSKDNEDIKKENQGLKKINSEGSHELSTRFKYIITSVNGDRTVKTIREFVDDYLISKDSLELRKYIAKISPGVNLDVPYKNKKGDVLEGVNIRVSIDANFFYPSPTE